MDAVDARFLQDPHMSDGGALRSGSRLSHTSEASLGELADTSALEASASPTWSPTHHALDGTRRRRAAAAATAAAVAAATSDTSPPQPKPKPRLMQSHSQSQLLSTSPPQRQAKAGRRSRGSSAARLRSSAAATTTGGDSAQRGRVDSFDIGPEEERAAPRPRRSRRRKGGRGRSAARSRAAPTAADGGSGGAATSTAATTTTAATTGSASTGDGVTNGMSSRAPSTRASPRSGRRSRNRGGGSTTATSERPSRRQSRRHAAGHSDATSDSNGESGVEYVPQQFGLAGSSSRSLLEGIGTAAATATTTGAGAGGGNATLAGSRTRTSSSDMGGVGRSRHSTSTRGEAATDESMESSTGSLQLKPPLSSRQTTSRRASRSSRASSATRKRLRLKCHYKGHIRVVAVSDRSSFRTLLARLAEDYSFEVSLRYEDADGDLITLASQNDLNELLEHEAGTVVVHVSEAASGMDLSRVLASPTPAASRTSMHLHPLDEAAQRRAAENQAAQAARGSATPGTASRPSRKERHMHLMPIASPSPRGKIRYQRGQVIGQGATGTVFLGLNVDNGELMAIKQMDTNVLSKKEMAALENEVNMMRGLYHENIVRYLGTERTDETLSIFMEYVPGGSIRQLLDKFGPFEEAVVRVYTRQLLLGLEVLHRNGIAHRDIKGANVLVANDGTVKLADFGASKQLGNVTASHTGVKGTPHWMAPEVIREQQAETGWRKADIWSVGCTIVEMVTGKPPFSQYTNPVTAMYHIACQDSKPDIPDGVSEPCLELLQLCFKRDPSERPDVGALLLHSFVTSLAPTHMRHLASGLVRPATAGHPASRGTPFGALASPMAGARNVTASPFTDGSSSTTATPGGSRLATGGGTGGGVGIPKAATAARLASAAPTTAGNSVSTVQWENAEVLDTLRFQTAGSELQSALQALAKEHGTADGGGTGVLTGGIAAGSPGKRRIRRASQESVHSAATAGTAGGVAAVVTPSTATPPRGAAAVAQVDAQASEVPTPSSAPSAHAAALADAPLGIHSPPSSKLPPTSSRSGSRSSRHGSAAPSRIPRRRPRSKTETARSMKDAPATASAVRTPRQRGGSDGSSPGSVPADPPPIPRLKFEDGGGSGASPPRRATPKKRTAAHRTRTRPLALDTGAVRHRIAVAQPSPIHTESPPSADAFQFSISARPTPMRHKRGLEPSDSAASSPTSPHPDKSLASRLAPGEEADSSATGTVDGASDAASAMLGGRSATAATASGEEVASRLLHSDSPLNVSGDSNDHKAAHGSSTSKAVTPTKAGGSSSTTPKSTRSASKSSPTGRRTGPSTSSRLTPQRGRRGRVDRISKEGRARGRRAASATATRRAPGSVLGSKRGSSALSDKRVASANITRPARQIQRSPVAAQVRQHARRSLAASATAQRASPSPPESKQGNSQSQHQPHRPLQRSNGAETASPRAGGRSGTRISPPGKAAGGSRGAATKDKNGKLVRSHTEPRNRLSQLKAKTRLATANEVASDDGGDSTDSGVPRSGMVTAAKALARLDSGASSAYSSDDDRPVNMFAEDDIIEEADMRRDADLMGGDHDDASVDTPTAGGPLGGTAGGPRRTASGNRLLAPSGGGGGAFKVVGSGRPPRAQATHTGPGGTAAVVPPASAGATVDDAAEIVEEGTLVAGTGGWGTSTAPAAGGGGHQRGRSSGEGVEIGSVVDQTDLASVITSVAGGDGTRSTTRMTLRPAHDLQGHAGAVTCATMNDMVGPQSALTTAPPPQQYRADGTLLPQPRAGGGVAADEDTFGVAAGVAASGSLDGTIRVWDVAQGRLLALLEHSRVRRSDSDGNGGSSAAARHARGGDGADKRRAGGASALGQSRTTTGVGGGGGGGGGDSIEMGASHGAGAIGSGAGAGGGAGAGASAGSTAGISAAGGGLESSADLGLYVMQAPQAARRSGTPVATVRRVGSHTNRGGDDSLGSSGEQQQHHQKGGVQKVTTAVTAIAVLPTSSFLMTGTDDGFVWVWDIASGKRLRKLRGHTGSVRCLAFHTDGMAARSSGNPSSGGPLDRRGLSRGRVLGGRQSSKARRGKNGKQRAFAVLAGTRAASGSQDQTIRIWDLSQRRALLHTLRGHTGPVNRVSFMPHSWLAVSCSADASVRVWDIRTGRQTVELKEHFGSVSCVVVVPAHLLKAVPKKAKKHRKRTAAGGARSPTPGGGGGGGVAQRTSSRLGATSTSLVSRAPQLQATNSMLVESGTHSGGGESLWGSSSAADGSDSESVAASVATASTLGGHTAASSQVSALHRGRVGITGRGTLGMQVSGEASSAQSGGSGLLSGARDGSIKLWDLETGESIRTLRGHARAVTGLCMPPNPAATPESSFFFSEANVGVYAPSGDAGSGGGGSSGSGSAARSSQGGTALVTLGGGGSISSMTSGGGGGGAGRGGSLRGRSLSPESMEAPSTPNTTSSGSSHHMASTLRGSGSGGGSSSARGELGGGGGVRALAGKVMSCGSDGTLRLWNYQTGRCLRMFEGHRGPVACVAWGMPNVAASGGLDGTVRVWNVNTGVCVVSLALSRPGTQVSALDWKGEWLLAGYKSGAMKVWRWVEA